MTDAPEERDPTAEAVEAKARRVRKRRQRPRLFVHLAHVGVLGWVFILPVIALAWLGHFIGGEIDALWPAVAGVVCGVALGAYLTWRNVRDGLRTPPDEEAPR